MYAGLVPETGFKEEGILQGERAVLSILLTASSHQTGFPRESKQALATAVAVLLLSQSNVPYSWQLCLCLVCLCGYGGISDRNYHIEISGK